MLILRSFSTHNTESEKTEFFLSWVGQSPYRLSRATSSIDGHSNLIETLPRYPILVRGSVFESHRTSDLNFVWLQIFGTILSKKDRCL